MLKHLFDYNENEEFDQVLQIKYSQLRQGKRGQSYLALRLGDASGEVRSNYWDASPIDAERLKAGTLAQVNGKLEDYQGHLQIKLFSIRPIKPTEAGDLAEFTAASPVTPQEMEGEIQRFVKRIDNVVWQQVVTFLLKKWHERFYTYPAGKTNHHAIKGGLALHTLTMLKDAQAIAGNYPQVNRSLLYAGCILHDLGKVLELSGPTVTSYTSEGNLIGHLVLIDEQVMLAAQQLQLDLTSEDLLLLRHLVLSHHGQLEYGSPKQPAILEAELLHRIDDLDAAVYAITKNLQNTKPGQFTEPVNSQNGRRYYRPIKDLPLDQSPKLG